MWGVFKSIHELPEKWRKLERGTGCVSNNNNDHIELSLGEVEDGYANSQIDDHPNLRRSEFCCRPPLSLKIKARMKSGSESPKGTAGFGFWNDPFMMTDHKMPTLPKAVWFFWSSSHSAMELAQGVPGHGWKMAVMDAWRWPFLALIPTIPLSIPLMWIRQARERLWPVAQKAMICEEKMCSVSLLDWHHYEIRWLKTEVHFLIDGKECLRTSSPKGPLGLVIWIDNQYMRTNPKAIFSHGLLKLKSSQSLEIDHFELSHSG